MKLKTIYEDRELGFEVIYRNRRTLAIQVKTGGEISVFSPVGLSQDYIVEKVKSKGKWILKKLSEFSETGFSPAKKQYVNGESFLYLGKNYSFYVLLNRSIIRPKIEMDHNSIYIFSPSKEEKVLKAALQKWYRKEAEKIILKRAEYFKKLFDPKPAKIKIKEQKRRWGSCSASGNIYFNWRIVMAPEEVIDYIVIHELAHLVHRNHSPLFYRLVESIMPDYRLRRKWLKDSGAGMEI